MAEAKKAVSEAELRSQIEAFEAENGGTVDLFRRITAVRPPRPRLLYLYFVVAIHAVRLSSTLAGPLAAAACCCS